MSKARKPLSAAVGWILTHLSAKSPSTQKVKKLEKDPPGQQEMMRTPSASYGRNLNPKERQKPMAGNIANCPSMPITAPMGRFVCVHIWKGITLLQEPFDPEEHYILAVDTLVRQHW